MGGRGLDGQQEGYGHRHRTSDKYPQSRETASPKDTHKQRISYNMELSSRKQLLEREACLRFAPNRSHLLLELGVQRRQYGSLIPNNDHFLIRTHLRCTTLQG